MEEKFDYGEALAELDRIAEKVEDPSVPLADIEAGIRRADVLIRACREYLRGARERLDKIN